MSLDELLSPYVTGRRAAVVATEPVPNAGLGRPEPRHRAESPPVIETERVDLTPEPRHAAQLPGVA